MHALYQHIALSENNLFSRKMSNVHAFVMVHVNPNVLRVSVTTYVNIIMGILEGMSPKVELILWNLFERLLDQINSRHKIEEAMEAIWTQKWAWVNFPSQKRKGLWNEYMTGHIDRIDGELCRMHNFHTAHCPSHQSDDVHKPVCHKSNKLIVLRIMLEASFTI